MREPYLVQRLNAPRLATPFDFGGGLLNGGINKEAMDIINKVLSFDYMGSAEFEWGAVPAALSALNNKGAISFVITCKETPVYIICLPKDKDDVENWVKKASVSKHGHLKEHLGFEGALNKEKYCRSLGWLKIEHHDKCYEPFMFFIDKTMFDGMCKLLEVKQLTE